MNTSVQIARVYMCTDASYFGNKNLGENICLKILSLNNMRLQFSLKVLTQQLYEIIASFAYKEL